MNEKIELVTQDEVAYETNDFTRYERKIDLNADKYAVKAPLPATVEEIIVSIGRKVKKGDLLLRYEAMKMYNPLQSPLDGVVEEIMVKKGERIKKNQVLIQLKP